MFTQPKHHTAFLRLSAMISRYFTAAVLPVVLNRLRCGFAQFKLCAHFL